MKKSFILSVIILLSVFYSFSQVGIDLRKYKLGEIPTTTPEEDEKFKDNNIATLCLNYALDYYVTDDKFELWELKHQAIKILKEKEIENFETISFGKLDPESFQNIQVRVIYNGDVVKSYSKKDLETSKKGEEEEDESEDYYPVCKIKLSDIKVGTIIEFFYTRIRPSVIQEGDYYLQSENPTKNINYTIIMPQHLKPHVQVYNGDYTVLDTVIESKAIRYTTVSIPYLTGLPIEPMSFHKKHCCRIEFNYAYNLSTGRIRINTTKDFVHDFFERSQLTDKKIIKIAQKEIIKKIKVDKNGSIEDNIRTIENFLKANIFGIDGMQSIRIYSYVLDHFDIKYEIVLTCDKNKKEFDKSYNGRNFYDEILFYFPEIDKYIAPMEYSNRLGLTPINCNGNSAIYLKKIEVGKNTSFTHSFKTIPITPKSVTVDELNLDLSINPSNGNVSGKIKRIQGGYKANIFQSYFKFFEGEEIEQIVEEIFSLGFESMNISNEKFINTDIKDIGVNPMISTADISNSEWAKVNEDGSIDVFVGKMIGKQDKLETTKQRVLPIEREYASSYKREIKIVIPEGYKVDTIAAIYLEQYDSDDQSKATARFYAYYDNDGKHILVKVIEYYDNLFYAAEDFNLIQRVTDLAAAFNDITIKLIKK